MQFQFTDQDGEYGGTGWAIFDNPGEHPAGFTILLHPLDGNSNDHFAEVTFSIGELRQMLAEAEELAGESESLCNCDCQTYAPLATEQELADEAQKVPADDNTPSPRDEIERLLRKAETQADSTVDFCIVAQARKDLLG